jgi:hypothetical protein|tara:strand:- start:115 stop:417 length:303 start_codon:yes stop_codon:yes gene_type:complete
MLRNPDSLPSGDTLIQDPAMEPYFITRSQNHEYTVFERVVKGENNTPYLRTLGYPSNFRRALKIVMKELLDFKGQTKFDTLEDYFNKWEKINKNLMNLNM